jgi:hypothetical protein
VPIRAYLDQHSVRTASQQGWDKLKNGDLLTAAENAGFIGDPPVKIPEHGPLLESRG